MAASDCFCCGESLQSLHLILLLAAKRHGPSVQVGVPAGNATVPSSLPHLMVLASIRVHDDFFPSSGFDGLRP